MTFDWPTFLFQTVNFAVLVFLLYRFLYRPVLGMVDARRKDIDATLAGAEQSRQEAKAELSDLQVQRADIARERDQALAAAARQAEAAAQARLTQAEAERAAFLAQGRKTLEEERAKALADMTGLAGQLAVSIAEHLVAEAPPELRTAFWLDRLARDLAGRPQQERAQLGRELAPDRPLRIVTPQPLAEAEHAHWQDRFAVLLSTTAPIRFEADASLAAGAELHFPDAILRFSWKSELERIHTEVLGHADHP